MQEKKKKKIADGATQHMVHFNRSHLTTFIFCFSLATIPSPIIANVYRNKERNLLNCCDIDAVNIAHLNKINTNILQPF